MDSLDLFQIHQTWTDLREARVKDGFIFRVSRYFIDRWLRLLGPKAAWTVVDLQQRCYLAKADSCRVSLKNLCTATGVRSTTTMQAIVDEPLIRWFFAKRNTRQRRAGKVVRGKNHYDLQMSDPLTPEHQGKVARLLAERLRDGTVEAIRSPDDLIRLASDLPLLSTLPSGGLPAWATREPLNLRQIALRVLSEVGIAGVQASLADETALRQTFADAQARITRPTRIALTTHYFRTEWVPQLGATNAWLVTALRSRCYWNKASGQIRDTCVMSIRELADLLGTSTRTVIRGLQDPLVRKFVAAQERVYEPRPDDGRKIPARTRFQVHLAMDPLTPPDEATFAQILLSDAARYGLDPATGQMDMMDILDMMSQMTSDDISRWHGRPSDKIEIRERSEAKPSDKIEIRGRSETKPSDKIEIRKPPSDTSTLASSDKNETRTHPTGAVATPETGPGDKNETSTPQSGPLLPPPNNLKGHFEAGSSDKIEIRGDTSDKTGFRTGESSDKNDTIAPESSDKNGKQYLNTSINTGVVVKGRQQQQYPAVADSTPSLRQILVQYGIGEPSLSNILANPQVTPKLARAWMLYAENEPGLRRKAGYVVQRLTRAPPDVPADADLLLVASLNDDDLICFAQRRALELRMAASVSFGDERREAQYGAWLRFYGHDEGGISRGDETTLESGRGRASRWQPDVG